MRYAERVAENYATRRKVYDVSASEYLSDIPPDRIVCKFCHSFEENQT